MFSDSTGLLDKHLPKFDKVIIRELRNLMNVPDDDEELRAKVEDLLSAQLTDSIWKKLYALFYKQIQRSVADKFDVIKELLKYRVSKQPKQHEAIHFYLHPDIMGNYDSKTWIRQSETAAITDTSEISSEPS